MGSQNLRTIRLSESASPKNFAATNDELDGIESKQENERRRPDLVGTIKEKGFTVEPQTGHRVSLPQPRVTPFPVARHRSEGPHWRPPSSKKFSDPVVEFDEDHVAVEASAPEMAAPLSRRKSSQSVTSKWKSGRKSELSISFQIQNELDDRRQQNRPQETAKETVKKRDYGGQQMESRTVVEVVADQKESVAKQSHRQNGASQKLELSDDVAPAVELREDRKQMPLPTLLEDRSLMGRAKPEAAEQATQSGLNATADQGIDAENRKALLAMSLEDVTEAQAELSQKLRPDLLELLRRRGAEKERKRLSEKKETSIAMTVSDGSICPESLAGHKKEVARRQSASPAENIIPITSIQPVVNRMTDDQTVSKRMETVRGTTVGPADLFTAAAPSFAQEEIPSTEAAADESIPPPPETDPWTLRVEAVRSMRFDLHGNVAYVDLPSQSNNPVRTNVAAGVLANGLHNSLSVTERDYLRTEGDPVGAGYSLKETLALVRSTVPGQRAVALHLISSVLEKAIQGLQAQKCNQISALHGERAAGGGIDWQAIWAYALGPEAELVLTLRLALDDGHSTVVAACARAIQALLCYCANESYFDSLEVLWPAQKAVYTAPVFRKKTKYDEGFIGGGRWKYNVKTSELFPFSDTAAVEKSEEDAKDTVADDSHVSNKDVAAGLIRMGILPRTRYLLEVDQLIAAEEPLLNVLICLARHSPTAANAVMTCPRLIDAILQRFIGTDEHISKESWSSRLKAIRLLKVLSQAKRGNCVYFERIGALQTVMAPLLRQGYGLNYSGIAEQGYYEIMIEIIRFWRVCVGYGIGILFFSDCYSTLCVWLLPLSREEILSADKDGPLSLAMESYLLLEHIARTLPALHVSDDLIKQVDVGSWSWSVAQAMLDTAMKWLSPERISGVQVLLAQQCVQACEPRSQGTVNFKRSIRRLLGIVASVLHFLATICERIVSKNQLQCALEDPENFSLPWLPTFLPKLGLTLARCGLLDYSLMHRQMEMEMPNWTPQSDMSVCVRKVDLGGPTGMAKVASPTTLEKKVTFLGGMKFCLTQADYDSALEAINCLNALVRANSIVDSLMYIAKPKASPPVEDQTVPYAVLERGLLRSSETELKELLDLCKENFTLRKDLLQMSIRGGPAPGVGIGWGCISGGVWSKEFMIAQASAKLALDLMTVSRVWLSHPESGDTRIERSEPSDQFLEGPFSDLSFCLTIAASAAPVNKKLVLKACSDIIFHPSTLSFLIQKIEAVLARWRENRQEEGIQAGRPDSSEDRILDPNHLSSVLMKHCENFWLASKKRESKQDVLHKVPSQWSKGLGSNLPTVQEESGEDSLPHPESLMVEWVGQRLPLPSHWFLSPMVGNLLLHTNKNLENGIEAVSRETAELDEEVIKAGLAFFLGFEILKACVSEAHSVNISIPLVRKVHSLSTVFVSGGEVFLDATARDLIGALQNLLGVQIGGRLANSSTLGTNVRRASGNDEFDEDGHGFRLANAVQDETSAGDMTASELTMTEGNTTLDFEGSVDPNYLNYAQAIAEQFVATSYGDHVFGRQVALHLCLDVPAMIRLAAWRVLSDGRVLELLPPLSQCIGPPHKYLYPVETDQQILESYVTAWSSGALDKAAKRNSMSFTLALHHLSGYLFDTSDTEETFMLKTKTARALIRSTNRKFDRQILSRLVHYVPPCSPFNNEQHMKETETKLTQQQVTDRLSLLLKTCGRDTSLMTEVQRLQKLFEAEYPDSVREGLAERTSRLDSPKP